MPIPEALNLTFFKALTFDCYGTLIDWEAAILEALLPEFQKTDPDLDPNRLLVVFAQIQAQQQKKRPALPYPEILSRTYLELGASVGKAPDEARARRFAESPAGWPPFPVGAGRVYGISQGSTSDGGGSWRGGRLEKPRSNGQTA